MASKAYLAALDRAECQAAPLMITGAASGVPDVSLPDLRGQFFGASSTSPRQEATADAERLTGLKRALPRADDAERAYTQEDEAEAQRGYGCRGCGGLG